MKVSMNSLIRPAGIPAASAILRISSVLLAFGMFAGSAHAANLMTAVMTPSSGALTCNTATGPGANLSILVKAVTALTGANTIAVTVTTLPAGVTVITTPADPTLKLANNTTGLTFVVNYTAGCAGATAVTATAGAIQFSATPSTTSVTVADVSVNSSRTVTAAASALTATPSPVSLICTLSGGSYTPGVAKTVTVKSAATGGTPFTVDTATAPVATWLTVTPTTGGTANAAGTATGNTFTVRAAAGCGGYAAGTTNTTTVHLLNTPAPDKTVSVTLQIVTPSTLVIAPLTTSLTYVKGSGTAGKADVAITSAASPAPFFSVDTTSLPVWLTVDTLTGTTPKTIRFSSTSVADNMAPGTYTGTVNLKVSGAADKQVPISLLVTNQAPKLSLVEGNTRNISWTLGQALPTPTITAVSSDSPISYSLTTGGTLAPIVATAQQQGLAYNFGTQIGVTFDPLIFAAATPGTVLTGTVTLKYGTPVATTVVTFNVTILAPGAAVSSLSPASIPTAAAGQTFTVVLIGSGFVPSTDPLQKTKVGIVVGGVLVTDTNIASSVVDASKIILTITVPATTDTYLPFATTGAGGPVNLGVCNPSGGTCTVATGTAVLTIGVGPIIQAVTSASAFQQVSLGQVQQVAPFDMISIFGTNFCSSNGTGCTSVQVLFPTPDATLRYPAFVSPDATGTTQRKLSVTFQTHATPPVVIATAPILFATNTQINLLVPQAVSAQIGNAIDMVVSFGYGTATTTLLSSAAYPLNVVATNPGLFTVGSNGQGQGAILKSSDYSLIDTGFEAGVRSTAADSDTVLIYLTGLGVPDSIADNASSGSSAWSADCVSMASYLASLNGLGLTSSALTNLDGTVIQSSLINSGRLSPCVISTSANKPSVTFGGVAGTVGYAGWVADSVTGLYQINVKLPASTSLFTDVSGGTAHAITAPVQVPVVVTADGVASQAGVTMWVAPRLKVTAPTVITGTVGTAWTTPNNLVVATQGSGTYRYAVTSGLLPTGLSLNAATGAITGTPAANTNGTYVVTVTATDYATIPVSGTVTFTLTIGQGLYVTLTGAPPFATGISGTVYNNLTQIAGTGGIAPYQYTITAGGTGITIDKDTGYVSIDATALAGTYHMTVTVTDSTPGSPLTGTIHFDISLALKVTFTGAPLTATKLTATPTLTTVTAAGGTAGYTYAIVPAVTGFSISGGVVSIADTVDQGTYSITVVATDSTAGTALTGSVTFNVTLN
jgi:uncharacterized protein (TIGR03437 family)